MKRLWFILFLMATLFQWGQASTLSRHWNKGRGYQPFKYATSEALEIDNLTDKDIIDGIELEFPLSSLELSFRAANLHAHPSKRYEFYSADRHLHFTRQPQWGFFVTTTSGDTLFFRVGRKEIKDVLESGADKTLVCHYGNGKIINISDSSTVIGIDPYSGINRWDIKFSDHTLRLQGGNRTPMEVATVFLPQQDITGFGFFVGPAGSVHISDISLQEKESSIFSSHSSENMDSLISLSEDSDDALEGIWSVFDRELDEDLLRLGGNYMLAIKKEEDHYDIIYLDGATVNSSRWQPGRRKGILTPTLFPGIYNLEWFDAEGNPLSHEIKAQEADGNILQILFPYQSSSLRLRKVNLRR